MRLMQSYKLLKIKIKKKKKKENPEKTKKDNPFKSHREVNELWEFILA